MKLPRCILALALLWGGATARADEPGRLFENVVEALNKQYYDKAYRKAVLPGLAGQFREAAHGAKTAAEERLVIHEFLSNIPASHLALISDHAYQSMYAALLRRDTPAFGLELVELDSRYFVHSVLEGGPAQRAGVLTGDRVITIDGAPVKESPRLDWRTDDAYLPDPPIHALLCEEGDRIVLELEHTPDDPVSITIDSALYTAFDAAKASARIFERDGYSVAYVHFWFIHISGTDTLLKELMAGPFANADALVLDLRGRGGSAAMVKRVTSILSEWGSKTDRPVIAIIDSMTRSAKEAIAYRIRANEIGVLVGQRTAGALLPAKFVPVSEDAVLMLPFMRLGGYTDNIEGVGVQPHVPVEPSGPYSAGHDALIEGAIDEAVKQIDSGVLHRSTPSDPQNNGDRQVRRRSRAWFEPIRLPPSRAA